MKKILLNKGERILLKEKTIIGLSLRKVYVTNKRIISYLPESKDERFFINLENLEDVTIKNNMLLNFFNYGEVFFKYKKNDKDSIIIKLTIKDYVFFYKKLMPIILDFQEKNI